MRLLAALALVGAGGLSACSGGDADAQAAPVTTTTTTTPPTTAAPTTTTTPAPVPVAPLTGLPEPDPARRERPALVLKIDNDNRHARPQVGLDRADVVFEELVEGGATRFAAVFQSADSDPVGPIRSARTTDATLVANLGMPLFGYAGANAGVEAHVRRAPLVNVGWSARPGEYRRERSRRAPNNLFTTTTGLYAGATGAGTPRSLFQYRAAGEAPPPTSVPSSGVHLEFGGGVRLAVDWQWHPSGQWLRSQAGTPHTVEGGAQIAAANVVVQVVEYHDSGFVDVTGATSPEAELIGSGDALVLTDGKVITGRWTRPSGDAPTTYTDGSGMPIRLTPGRTWVELARPGQAAVTG